MKISVDLALKTDAAAREAKKFEDDFVADMMRAASSGESAYNKFADATEAELRDLAKQTKDAAEKSSRYWEKFASDARGFVGDIGDGVSVIGESLLGLSGAEKQAAEDALYLTEKGAALGEVFGPLGALIGGVAGAAIGAAQAMNILAKESNEFGKMFDKLGVKLKLFKYEAGGLTEKLFAALAESDNLAKETQKNFEYLGGYTLKELQKEVSRTRDELEDLTFRSRDGTVTSKQLAEAREAATKAESDYSAALGKSSAASAKATQANEAMVASLLKSLKKFGEEREKSLNDYANKRAAIVQKEYDEYKAALQARADLEYQFGLNAVQTDKDWSAQITRTRKAAREKEKEDLETELQEKEDLYEGYINSVTGGLSNFTTQLEENVRAGNALFADMGTAALSAVSDVLKALGKQWAVQAIGELAHGFALLAQGKAPQATSAFTSAATYGAAAVAAGVGGAVTSGLAGREGGSSGGGEASAAGGGSASQMARDEGTQTLTPIVINFSSTVPANEREAQEIADTLASYLDRRPIKRRSR